MVEANTTKSKMQYRYLGNTGLSVSVLGWGNWVNTAKEEETEKMVKLALESGINFFDTAEIYGFGQGEISLGKAFKNLKVRRESIVVTTKMFRSGFGVNDCMLSRKHIVEGLNNSLKRLQLDYVDVIFCHRYDELTPIEEVCRAMNYCIEQGKAFYWATSEWDGCQIMEAYAVCDRLGLIRPIADQCQYNMMTRNRMENDYCHLFDNYKMGTTTWSPLLGGVLTGKYKEKVDLEGSRFDEFAQESRMHKAIYTNCKESWDKKLTELAKIAETLGGSLPQLALAWVVNNPNTSSCLLGTSRVSQLEENLKALELVPKLTKEIEADIEKILDNAPDAKLDWRTFSLKPKRREFLMSKK